MTGTIIVWVAFIGAIVSAAAYYQAAASKRPTIGLARKSFFLSVAGIIAASVLLMAAILRHDFTYSYVWGYSSTDLPTHLLISTFWAGQEGSFLFWALCSALVGIALYRYTRKNRIEYEVMAVYAMTMAFLLLLMIVKSPFETIWDAYPGQIAAGQAPAEGKGLNPLLHSFWMIAHPPVLFVGFAALAVPFALAIAALWRKMYSDWIKHALPWVLFGAVSLGAGIMIGGYWAYGVLGWGGWWGWDPVENSSLIPWITTVILLHTLVVQKRTGSLVRMNYFLAIVSFVLVIYSTFLTRSGVLGSASVHSFGDPGAFAYTLLVIWMAVMGLGGGAVLLTRWKELKPLGGKVGTMTRESFIALASVAMGASALVIFFGTSWPIVANASVEPSFYDNMNLPIAAIMSAILGLSLLLMWRQESGQGLLQRASLAFGISVVVLIVLIAAGMTDWIMMALALTSLFALVVNVMNGYRVARDNPRNVGGPLAHVGLAILFLGIIGSGRYGQKITTGLPLNETKEIFGYKTTYVGAQPTSDGKWQFVVHVEKDQTHFSLAPVMFKSDYNNSIMRNPDYAMFLTRDFYIEPVSLEAGSHVHDHDVFELTRGEPKTIEDMRVTFVRFEMAQHGVDGMMSGGGFGVGAVLEVEREGRKETLTAITSYSEGGEPQPQTVMMKDGKIGFQMLSMNVNNETRDSRIQLNVLGLHEHGAEEAETPEMLVVEASLKPFMSLVWIATILVLGGLTLSMMRRGKELAPTSHGSQQQAQSTGRQSGRQQRAPVSNKETEVTTVS
jgi:cytochrome c-type biogenesis protein CcmF